MRKNRKKVLTICFRLDIIAEHLRDGTKFERVEEKSSKTSKKVLDKADEM